MEKFLICIPSRNRAEKLFKNTYSFVQHSKYPFKIFVEPSQEEQYLEYFDKSLLVIMKKNNQGLRYAKMEIMNYCLKNKIEFVMKMDDDINNIRNRQITEIKKTVNVDRKYRAQNFLDKAIQESIDLLGSTDEIKAVSFYYGHELREEDPTILWSSLNNRLQSSYIVKTEYLCPDLENIFKGTFEDMDTGFSIIHAGFFTIRHEQLGLDYVPVGTGEGGLQDFDRKLAANKSYEYMSKKYPYLKWKTVDKAWDKEPDIRRTPEFQTIKL